MSCCNQCGQEIVVNVPGVAGSPGGAGTNGINAFTITTSATVLPAANATVTAAVASSAWMSVGQIVFMSDGTNFGTFQVVSFPSSSAALLTWLDYPGDAVTGTSIATGATVSPAGIKSPLAGALPTAFTDNTTGTASDTLAAGAGVSTIPLYVNLVGLANHDLMTSYVPGYAFKILAVDFVVEQVVTTASKLATLTPYIGATALTGGVLSLTSANCTPQGALVSGTAVTAANTGTATDTVTITASSVTAFAEGGGWIMIRIQNMDTANALASLATHIDALITALT